MKIGVKKFTYATYASGGDGAAVVYSDGVMTDDRTVNVEYTTERDDASFYADDHRIEHDNSITGCNVALELATLTTDMMAKLLGWTVSGTDYQETGEEAPYVGCGWIVTVKEDGARKYRAVWVYKVQFGMETDSVATKGQNMEYQTENITGAGMGVKLAEDGPDIYRVVSPANATLAAAVTWLKGKAGIS
jgi:phi13 family phage major tail protein